MNILKILVFLLLTSFYKPNEGCSNIYLIRHAEKVRTDKSDRDPDLNKNGFLRAINWKNYFSDKELDWYESYFRTKHRSHTSIVDIKNKEIILHDCSKNSFLNGLITNIFNIKAFLFFVSLFSIIIDNLNGIYFYIYPLYFAVMSSIWFIFLSFIVL